jgi:hypothetical protein
MRQIPLRPTPSGVIAVIALVVALTGTGVAAAKFVLPSNSVGTAQLRANAVTNSKIASNAVTSAKVKNGSLLRADFRSGQVPAGPAGPAGVQGSRGPTGPAGTSGGSPVWALVSSGGGVIASSGGVSVQHPSTGNYYVVFGSAVTGKAIFATQAYRDTDAGVRGGIIVTSCGGGTEGSACSTSNTSSTVRVIVENNGNTGNADHAFYVAAVS